MRRQFFHQAWFQALGVTTFSSAPTQPSPQTLEWNLMNGSVQFQVPYIFQEGIILSENPQLVGAGSGGAVFRLSPTSSYLVKVSWPGSTSTVRRECQTLQLLEKRGVSAAERCLGVYKYEQDNFDRVQILVTPFVDHTVANVSDLPANLQPWAVEQIARTLVQMLAAGIVTIDVQPLMDRKTGQVIFVDMTEAQELSGNGGFLEETLKSSFVSEMVALIPEALINVARQAARDELSNKQLSKSSATLLQDVLF